MKYSVLRFTELLLIVFDSRMLFRISLIVTIFYVGLVKSGHPQPHTFPDDFGFCNVESDHATGCLRDMIQNWMMLLGNPGINHPINLTIEPMIVDSWVLNVNLNFVNGTEYLRNSAFSGFSNCTIMSASYNPQNYTLVYTSYYPHILETGFSYNWGTISFEDGSTDAIYGRGGYDRHLYGSNITHRITFVPVHRDHGVEYLQVQRYELDSYGVRDTSVHWQNLYDGDTIRANRAFNRLAQNPMGIGAAVEGTLREGMTNMFRLYTEQLISSVPLRQLRRHFVNHS